MPTTGQVYDRDRRCLLLQGQKVTDPQEGRPGWPVVLLGEWATSVGTQTALTTNAGGFVQTHLPALLYCLILSTENKNTASTARVQVWLPIIILQ